MTAGASLRDRPLGSLLAGLGLLLVLHAVRRLLTGGSLAVDEAEQLLWAQLSWAWGYGEQPPLYNWLQLSAFSLLGSKLVAIVALKYTAFLLFTLLYAVLALGMLGEARRAALAVLCLFLIGEVFWEFPQARTHSVLVLVLVAATLLVCVRISDRPGLGNYLLLGLLAGVGALSKYNYLLFLAALVVALGSHPRYRPVLLDRRMLLAAAVMLVVLLPHGLWLLEHPLGVLPPLAHKLQPGTEAWNPLQGLLALLTACFKLGGVLLVAVALWMPSVFHRGGHSTGSHAALAERLIVAALLVAVTLVIASGATRLEGRWILPLVLSTPVFLAARVPPVVLTKRYRGMLATVVALNLAAFFVLALAPRLARYYHDEDRHNAPFAELAAAIRVQGEPTLILAQERQLAGNLLAQFPNAGVRIPSMPPLAERPVGSLLLAWAGESRQIPPALLRVAKFVPGAEEVGTMPVGRVSHPYRHSARVYTLHTLWWPGPGIAADPG
ncbi:MAG: glycosyltransferase family 39 protein [Gammaproteobacteria bacterium]|nr:glycosyltransferase family 39 protein [Gammaproteobacteria bacterium]